MARAAGRALDASVIVLDAASSVLAVACASPEDERAVMAGEAGTETVELRVADAEVGRLRYRPRGEPPPPALLRLVGNLIGLELERSRAPERATEAAVGDFLPDLLARRVTDRENIVARGGRAGLRPRRRRDGHRRPRAAAAARGGRLARARADARRARRPGDRARLAGGAGRVGLVAPRRERPNDGAGAAAPSASS